MKVVNEFGEVSVVQSDTCPFCFVRGQMQTVYKKRILAEGVKPRITYKRRCLNCGIPLWKKEVSYNKWLKVRGFKVLREKK